MDKLNVTLNILLDSLKNKYNYFQEIHEITKYQSEILSNYKAQQFDKTIEQKQQLIDKVNKLDEGFEIAFKSIKDELNKKSNKYKDSIIKLKEYITKITELSIKIEILEEKNKAKLENLSVVKNKGQYTQSKNSVINSYAKTKQLFNKEK